MRIRRLSMFLVIALMVGTALSLAALPDPVFLGAFSEPFTTFSVTGELVHPGELDWYAFDIASGDSTVFIFASDVLLEREIRVLLFDSQDEYIDTADGQILEAALPTGTYRIRIDSAESAVQSYSLVVFNGIEVESNDGLLESNDLGELAGPIHLLASLQPAGDADFYRFLVPESGLTGEANALVIETSGSEAADTTLILYQYDETSARYLPILSDDDSGVGYWSRSLLRPQPGGLYALRVEETMFPLAGIDEYVVTVNPIDLQIDVEPNDTSATAITLVPTSQEAVTWNADGLLEADDTIDFYRLVLEVPALLQINTESQAAVGSFDTLLTLYKPNGDIVAEDDDSGDSSWSRIVIALEAGEYYIAVETYGDVTTLVPYHLNVVAGPVKTMTETEPNDVDEVAELIAWNEGESLLIEAAIGLDGDIDSFRFQLNEETTIIFETRPGPGSATDYDTTLSVFDEDLWEVAYNDDAEGSWSRIEETLPAGSYYVVVEGYYDDESFEYSLLITASKSETETGAG